MPNKDGTANVGDALKHIGIAAIGIAVIYLTQLIAPGLLFIVPALACGAGGYFANGKATSPKIRKNTAIAWACVGMAAGIVFFIAL